MDMNRNDISNFDNQRINPRIRKLLKAKEYFHDWYIVSIYLSNTGENVVKYSHPGLTTVQITMATSNNDMSYTLIFVDVNEFNIYSTQHPYLYEKHFTFTGFQRVLDFSVEGSSEGNTKKIIINCESNSHILLSCRSITYRRNNISIYT